MMGKFISFEGLDGSGKSTQVRMLTDHLTQKGYRVISIKGHPAFEGIKERILDIDGKIDPMVTYYLTMAKHQAIAGQIQDLLAEYDYVIIDRYIDTSYAYTLANLTPETKKAFEPVINQIHSLFFLPQLTFFIDTPASEALIRKNNCFDRIELGNNSLSTKSVSHHFLTNQTAASANYVILSQKYPKRIKRIQGMQTKAEIHKDIISFIIPSTK